MQSALQQDSGSNFGAPVTQQLRRWLQIPRPRGVVAEVHVLRVITRLRYVRRAVCGQKSPKVQINVNVNVNVSFVTATGKTLPKYSKHNLPVKCCTRSSPVVRYYGHNELLFPARSAATNPSLRPSRKAGGAAQTDSRGHVQVVAHARAFAMTRWCLRGTRTGTAADHDHHAASRPSAHGAGDGKTTMLRPDGKS